MKRDGKYHPLQKATFREHKSYKQSYLLVVTNHGQELFQTKQNQEIRLFCPFITVLSLPRHKNKQPDQRPVYNSKSNQCSQSEVGRRLEECLLGMLKSYYQVQTTCEEKGKMIKILSPHLR